MKCQSSHFLVTFPKSRAGLIIVIVLEKSLKNTNGARGLGLGLRDQETAHITDRRDQYPKAHDGPSASLLVRVVLFYCLLVF